MDEKNKKPSNEENHQFFWTQEEMVKNLMNDYFDPEEFAKNVAEKRKKLEELENETQND